MIVATQHHQSAALPNALRHPTQSRGAADYPLDAHDLIDFARSPARWVNAEPPDPDKRPGLLDLIEVMHLTPEHLKTHYAAVPATYQAMQLECPNCGSSGPARVCRKCSLTRRNTVAERPWNAAAGYCRKWLEDAASRKLTPIPHQQWEEAMLAAARLGADESVCTLLEQSTTQVALTGTWHDTTTNLSIPLRSVIAYAPNEGTALDHTLGSLHLAPDVSHGAWARTAYLQGKPIAAALDHALWEHHTEDDRPNHLWVVVEREHPFLVARRRASPELLANGKTALQDILGAYARCLKSGDWPAFDPSTGELLTPWSEVHLEPWMTQGDGGRHTFFALEAAAHAAVAA